MTARSVVCTIVVLAGLLTGAAAVSVRAQAPAARAVPPVETLYKNAAAEEAAVRKVLTQPSPAPSVLKAVRTVVADFELVHQHYPTATVTDDALWRAARLAREAFDLFHESQERTTALRLFNLLASGYPSSPLTRQVTAEVTALNARKAVISTRSATPDTVAPLQAPLSPPTAIREPAPAAKAPAQARVSAEPAAPTSLAPSSPAAAAAPGPANTPAARATLATIKAIRRAVLKDVVRVVIELDMEVPFHDERIESPSRVFVDLLATKANPALLDQTLRFDADTDPVRQIRVGRHPNSTTRVVLETAGVSSYSVYPLYSPYRLVIDCLREQPARDFTTAVRPEAPAPRPAASALRPSTRTAVPLVVPPTPSSVAAGTLAVPAVAPALAPRMLPPIPVVHVFRLDAFTTPDAEELPKSAPSAPPAAAAVAAATLTGAPRTTGSVATGTAAPAVPIRHLEPQSLGGLSMARQLGLGVSRVVIDPGHGGHDPGARVKGLTEAELVLDIALRLEKLLATLPGVEVVLTRRDNQFIALQERTAIANREGADLFLSIHANASATPSARGVETYFLDFASNQGAAAVAARENATSGQTMGALQDVVKAIALNNKLDESRDFAGHVQREMLASLKKSNAAVKDLGVKKAPFVVLIGASMPSVLAEVSFLTNPQEQKLLKSGGYRQRIAQALFEGVKKYQTSLKGTSTITQ